MRKIIQITDFHLGPNPEFRLAGVETHASFLAVVEEACQLKPDLLLVTGDIAAEPCAEAYRQFFDAMHSTNIPMIWLPGNHDVASIVEATKNAAPYQKKYDVDNWRIFMMDSVVFDSPMGCFGEPELELLKQLLAENTQDHALVCLHHHPLEVGSEWLDFQCIADAPDFLRIVQADPKVRGVIWGHIHQAFERVIDDVLYASAPSTCIQFKPNSDRFALDDEYPGYRIIELSDDGAIRTEVRRVEVADFHVELDSSGY